MPPCCIPNSAVSIFVLSSDHSLRQKEQQSKAEGVPCPHLDCYALGIQEASWVARGACTHAPIHNYEQHANVNMLLYANSEILLVKGYLIAKQSPLSINPPCCFHPPSVHLVLTPSIVASWLSN